MSSGNDIQQAVNKLAGAIARKKKYQQDNRIYYIKLNPVQQKYFAAFRSPKFKTFVLKGTNRCSKTTTGVLSGFVGLFGYYPWDKDRVPVPWLDQNTPRKIRHLCDDFPKHVDQVVRPEYEKWAPKDRKLGFYKNGQSYISLIVDHKTESRVDFITGKQDPSDHEGWYGDMLIIDEPKSKEHYLASARGLIDRDGVDIFCMTLLKKYAWINREIFQGVDRWGIPRTDIAMFEGTAADNVGYGISSQAAVDRFNEKIYNDEAVRKARMEGVPEYLSDLVFQGFNRTAHLIKACDFNLPTEWPVYISIDYHPSKEVGVLFVARDPYDRLYVFEEIFEKMTPEETGEAIIEMLVTYHITKVEGDVLIDPLSKGDKNNVNTVFDRIETKLTPYDLTMRTAGKEKTNKHSGIARINSLMKGEAGNVGLKVTDNCRRLVYEFENQMKDPDTGIPLKKDDDLTECLYRIVLQDTSVESEKEQKQCWEGAMVDLYYDRCSAGGWLGL